MAELYRSSNGNADFSGDGDITHSNAPQDFSFPARIRIHFKGSSTDELQDATRQKFERLEKQWKNDTQFVSALSEKYLHECYASIIGMGSSCVPMILRSLRKSPTDWFYALRAITGANPVDPADAGDIKKMADAWIKWGQQRGLI